jgi:hypothetical protein
MKRTLLRIALILLVGMTLHAADLPVFPGWQPTPGNPNRLTNGSTVLAVIRIPTTDGPAVFAQTCLGDLQRLGDGFEIISFDFGLDIAGRTWNRLRYRLRLADTTKEQELWSTADGVTGWCLTISAPGHLDWASTGLRSLLVQAFPAIPKPPAP